ncbi:MAG: SOS response-associated peptidase, partial [Candidatus Cloacimonadaceae bacterium]|nr:SOS response-associated peptidase [Candidatus Cloacimonadaceae bacterium]
MCGRFAQVVKHEQLKKLQDELAIANRDQQIEINFNVRPTQAVAAIMAKPEGRILSFFRWGLIPSWSADLPKFQMINIRSETILEKPTFKTGLLRRRCIIPANGFYEWRKPDKTPFFIHARDTDAAGNPDFETRLQNSIIYMAGIFETWTGADGSYVPSLGIITTSPNRLISQIHDR